jgi:hypothetical protein
MKLLAKLARIPCGRRFAQTPHVLVKALDPGFAFGGFCEDAGGRLARGNQRHEVGQFLFELLDLAQIVGRLSRQGLLDEAQGLFNHIIDRLGRENRHPGPDRIS